MGGGGISHSRQHEGREWPADATRGRKMPDFSLGFIHWLAPRISQGSSATRGNLSTEEGMLRSWMPSSQMLKGRGRGRLDQSLPQRESRAKPGRLQGPEILLTYRAPCASCCHFIAPPAPISSPSCWVYTDYPTAIPCSHPPPFLEAPESYSGQRGCSDYGL